MRLPNGTGYIFAGILIGLFGLNTATASFIGHWDFLSAIALAFNVFSTGEFFRLDTIRKNDGKVIVITLLETPLASSDC